MATARNAGVCVGAEARERETGLERMGGRGVGEGEREGETEARLFITPLRIHWTDYFDTIDTAIQ